MGNSVTTGGANLPEEGNDQISRTRVDIDEATPDDGDAGEVRTMTLLELGEETMAQAMLIFLLADLRILSATGKIRTPFEHLSLDSDRTPRLTSQDYAGFYNYETTSSNDAERKTTHGVKANHIMAVLLIEILREAEEERGSVALLRSQDGEGRRGNSGNLFRGDVRAANNMPQLLHCYNTMLSDDIAPQIERVSRKKYPLDQDLGSAAPAPTVAKPGFGQKQSEAKQSSIESTSSLQRPHFLPEISSPDLAGSKTNSLVRQDDNDDYSLDSDAPRAKTIRQRVDNVLPDQLPPQLRRDVLEALPATEIERQQDELKRFADVQQQMLGFGDDANDEAEFSYLVGVEEPDMIGRTDNDSSRYETASQGFKPENEVIPQPKPTNSGQITGPLALSSETTKVPPSTRIPKFHNSKTIRTLISQAVTQRDWKRLSFLQDMFRPGTVSHTLAKSQAEMVWLSDWHEQYECTYAISIDRELSKVLLAFRGAYTREDWSHILDWYDTGTSNPVLDDYPNRSKNIRLHAGFYKYLFRVRKDTNTTKYDEIAAKLAHYCELADTRGDGNVRITITGHSLGSALATIFSLYVSTEDRFTSNGRAIECVTFGAPCIGNWRFAGAVKHQEDVGKLRIAKFHVKGDVTVHLPPTLLRHSRRGAQYWHSGVDVMLPYVRNKFFDRLIGQPKPKVTYHDPDKQGYLTSLLRQIRDFYMFNLPLRFWRFAMFHTLVEHRKRMSLVSKKHHLAEFVEDPEDLLLTNYTLKEVYEIRHNLSTRSARREYIRKLRREKNTE